VPPRRGSRWRATSASMNSFSPQSVLRPPKSRCRQRDNMSPQGGFGPQLLLLRGGEPLAHAAGARCWCAPPTPLRTSNGTSGPPTDPGTCSNPRWGLAPRHADLGPLGPGLRKGAMAPDCVGAGVATASGARGGQQRTKSATQSHMPVTVPALLVAVACRQCQRWQRPSGNASTAQGPTCRRRDQACTQEENGPQPRPPSPRAPPPCRAPT